MFDFVVVNRTNPNKAITHIHYVRDKAQRDVCYHNGVRGGLTADEAEDERRSDSCSAKRKIHCGESSKMELSASRNPTIFWGGDPHEFF